MRSAAGAVAFGPAERPVARGTRRPGGPHDRHRPAIPAVGAGPFGAGPAPRAEHGAVAFTPTWADTPAGLAGHHRSGPAVPAQVRVVAGGEPGDGSEPTAAAAAALWPAIAARTAGLAVPAGHDGERPAVDTRRGRATLPHTRTAGPTPGSGMGASSPQCTQAGCSSTAQAAHVALAPAAQDGRPVRTRTPNNAPRGCR